ncbi:Glycosyltransferase [hydrothermal vent metagenome]|uniref:Glycosyltransferase n=1 Tax=hydrothermal vent metagenome TaxID=652676 RepID=A0A3B0ZJH2_9ZZZZ
MQSNAKIKVVHLTFDMRIGGTEQVIKSLIENADTQQIEMSILCIESPLGPFANDLLTKGIHIKALSRSPGFDRNLIKKIRVYIKQHHINVLHCHQYTPWVYGVLAAFGTHTKVIFTEHGRFYPDSSSWKRKLINPWLHKITAATTAISQATKNALALYENLPANDIQVIYNGITPLLIDQQQTVQLRHKLAIGKDTLVLGTIARLDPIKNHLMMLNAFKKVLNKGVDAKLLIVGDGEMRASIVVLIKKLKLEQHVIMTGYQAKPHHHLALMDIYLLSSLSEGTSMTLLEAMSIGKPCVVTDAGGNPEIIAHGVNGIVTPNEDADAFADAIITLSSDSELKKAMTKQSRKRFEHKFSAASMGSQFQNLYQEITKT